MKFLKIRIEVGTSDSLFDIYYNSVSSETRALLYDTELKHHIINYCSKYV